MDEIFWMRKLKYRKWIPFPMNGTELVTFCGSFAKRTIPSIIMIPRRTFCSQNHQKYFRMGENGMLAISSLHLLLLITLSLLMGENWTEKLVGGVGEGLMERKGIWILPFSILSSMSLLLQGFSALSSVFF